jgi:hypothetical protein
MHVETHVSTTDLDAAARREHQNRAAPSCCCARANCRAAPQPQRAASLQHPRHYTCHERSGGAGREHATPHGRTQPRGERRVHRHASLARNRGRDTTPGTPPRRRRHNDAHTTPQHTHRGLVVRQHRLQHGGVLLGDGRRREHCRAGTCATLARHDARVRRGPHLRRVAWRGR